MGYMTPCTEPNEILTEVSFNSWPAGHGFDFREFAQRHGDFAIVGVGTLLTLDSDKRIDRIAAVLIGIDYKSVRLTEIEEALTGQIASEELFREAGRIHPQTRHDGGCTNTRELPQATRLGPIKTVTYLRIKKSYKRMK